MGVMKRINDKLDTFILGAVRHQQKIVKREAESYDNFLREAVENQKKEADMSTTPQFDLDALKAIPIDEVLEYYGAEPTRDSRYMTCFNNHEKGKARIALYPDKNICKCHNCDEVKGDPITVAKFVHGDFKTACTDLHEAFSIPYLNEQEPRNSKSRPQKPKERKPSFPAIDLIEFDIERRYKIIDFKAALEGYDTIKSKAHRFQLICTAIYRYSLKCDKKPMFEYHESRKLNLENPYMNQLGYLSRSDIKTMVKHLERYVDIDDLVEFGLYGDEDAKKPLQWKWMPRTGIVVVPNHNLYADIQTSLRFRNIDEKPWFKEVEISYEKVLSIPFGITPDMLTRKQPELHLTEGYPDGIALNEPFMMCPGANRFDARWFGLLHNVQELIVWFDMDKAGKAGREKFEAMAKHYAPWLKLTIKEWNEKLGKDPNDLLKNGNLAEVQFEDAPF